MEDENKLNDVAGALPETICVGAPMRVFGYIQGDWEKYVLSAKVEEDNLEIERKKAEAEAERKRREEFNGPQQHELRSRFGGLVSEL